MIIASPIWQIGKLAKRGETYPKSRYSEGSELERRYLTCSPHDNSTASTSIHSFPALSHIGAEVMDAPQADFGA